MKPLILALALLTGCSAVNKTALISSTASLACDWGQTRSMAMDNWKYGWEANPFLGEKPPPYAVDMYFIIVAGINTLTWMAMPKKYKWVIPTVVTFVQAPTIVENHKWTPGYCGFGDKEDRFDTYAREK